MDYTMLIDRILEAERSARDVAEEVKTQKANFEAELEQEKAAIRQKYLDRAKAWLEELKSQEEEKKEQLIAAQKVRLADANAKMERAYTRYGDNWVNTLFQNSVNLSHSQPGPQSGLPQPYFPPRSK